MSGPHDTSVPRLRQIAEDLSAEGWHTIAGTISQVADEKEHSRPDRRRVVDAAAAIADDFDHQWYSEARLLAIYDAFQRLLALDK